MASPRDPIGIPAKGQYSAPVSPVSMATEEEPRGDGCQVMAAERPQLLVTKLMVASAMLSCLWQISERGSVPYSEVYLDAIQNAARSRSWFRVPAGTQ